MYKTESADKYFVVEYDDNGNVKRVINNYNLENLISYIYSNTGYDTRTNRITYENFNFTGKDIKRTVRFETYTYKSITGEIKSYKRTIDDYGMRGIVVGRDLGNGYGSLIDVRNFENDVLEYRRRRLIEIGKPYRKKKHSYITGESYYLYDWYRGNKERVYKFRCGPVPRTGIRKYSGFYRAAKTIHNIKLIDDPEYGIYTRKTKVYETKYYWYDDFSKCISRSWKDNCKCRKQWQKNCRDNVA